MLLPSTSAEGYILEPLFLNCEEKDVKVSNKKINKRRNHSTGGETGPLGLGGDFPDKGWKKKKKKNVRDE